MKRDGYVLLMVVFAAVSLVFFGMSVSSLNQGYRTQVLHTKQMQASFQIAYSGFQRVLAKTYLKPWEERYFRNAPVAEDGISLFGGVYDSYVCDAPGQTNQADIYMRVALEGVTRSYVWRVEHVPDLLDSQYHRTIFFAEMPVKEFPAGSTAPYSNAINQKMQERLANQPKAEALANQIAGLSDLKDIANLLGAPPPNFPTTTQHSGIVPPAIPAPAPSVGTSPGTQSSPKPKKPISTSPQLDKALNGKGKANLKRVAFKPDSATLTTQSYDALDELAAYLKSRPDVKIVIVGHTADAISIYTHGQLSLMRAKSVFNYLKEKGVPGRQIDAVGKGSTQPIATNATKAGRAKNRRVEILKVRS